MGTIGNEALVPANYSFVARGVPAFNPKVKSARFMNGRGIPLNSLVELFLENDLSPGIIYDVYLEPFTGVDFSQDVFVATSPNWPSERSLSLWDFIPAINKNEDTSEHLEAFMLCIQDQLDTTLAWVDNWTEIIDADVASEKWLDLMLRDLGNPFFFEDISENDKRLLTLALVRMYQLKGTDPGIQAAIKFFLGFESQIHPFRHSGSMLGKHSGPEAIVYPQVISLLNDSFVLGAGGPFDFSVVVATTEAAGRELTDSERRRIEKIVSVVKPAFARLQAIFAGLESTSRVQIAGDEASVTVSWKQASPAEKIPAAWRVYYRRNEPGATPFNSSAFVEVSGETTTVTINTPIGTDEPGTKYFFVVVPFKVTEGFVSEEVRNYLAAPTGVAAVGGPRKITLTWNPVAGATSYRVYRTWSGASTPIAETAVGFDVFGGLTTFVDAGLPPGQTAEYSVVAVIGNSQGFYSASVTGTAA
jgi:phage tail-like protein